MKNRELILVIDMNPRWDGHLGWSMVPLAERINLQLHRWRSNCEILYPLFKNLPNSPFRNILGWKDLSEQPLLHPALTEAGESYEYSGYSVLNEKIKARLVDYERVYLCGIFTDVSVWKSALDIFELGVRPVVVTSLTETPHGEDIKAATLTSLRHSIGKDNLVLDL